MKNEIISLKDEKLAMQQASFKGDLQPKKDADDKSDDIQHLKTELFQKEQALEQQILLNEKIQKELEVLESHLNESFQRIYSLENFKLPFQIMTSQLEVRFQSPNTDQTIQSVKQGLVDAFEKDKYLDEVAGSICSQLRGNEGGNWLCFIKPYNSLASAVDVCTEVFEFFNSLSFDRDGMKYVVLIFKI